MWNEDKMFWICMPSVNVTATQKWKNKMGFDARGLLLDFDFAKIV